MDGTSRRITLDAPFDHAVAETLHAFHAEGFDVVSTLDLRRYLSLSAHHDCRRYLLVEMLLPQLALDAVREDPELGPMLPTTVAIFELPDGETVVMATPSLGAVLFDFGWRAGKPAAAAVADRAAERVARAFERLHDTGEGVRVVTRSA
jgi:uncharacterized protein (DUF302 family)